MEPREWFRVTCAEELMMFMEKHPESNFSLYHNGNDTALRFGLILSMRMRTTDGTDIGEDIYIGDYFNSFMRDTGNPRMVASDLRDRLERIWGMFMRKLK